MENLLDKVDIEISDFKGDIVSLIDRKDVDLTENLDEHDLRDTLDYDGSLHELVDGMIDIYNHDLRKWSVDNYNYVEDAISEGLADGTDFHKSIQAGQYLYYSEIMNQELSEIVEEFNELLEKSA